jgi:hypothetical protein
MAMLMTNQVFAKTWGDRAGPEPTRSSGRPSSRDCAAGTRRPCSSPRPTGTLEWTLQQQGFDFCYDKRLYDRIVGRDVAGVRDHLRAGLDYQSRLVRFGENHDEPRIADRLPGDAGGPRRWPSPPCPAPPCGTKGSFEGRRVRPPVFLSRRPTSRRLGLAAWYRRLLARVASHRYGRATGSCSSPAAGPTTIPAATSSPGPGPAPAAPGGGEFSAEPAQGRIGLGRPTCAAAAGL